MCETHCCCLGNGLAESPGMQDAPGSRTSRSHRDTIKELDKPQEQICELR